MGMNERRTKERRFVYRQWKVPTGWGPLKFRDAGGGGSGGASHLGACPYIAPHPCARDQHETETQTTKGEDEG
jgi:hypothetical protein